MSTLSVFQNPDGIEIIIDTKTGESFCTQAGYARMSGLTQQGVNKRCKTYNQDHFKKAEIQTVSGIKTHNLIPAKLAFKWLLRDNIDLAEKMGEAGATIYFHQIAGYKVTSTATTQQQPKSRDPHPLPVSLEAAHLARFIAETAGCNNAMVAQLAVNAAIAVNPALTPARDELKVAAAVTDTEDDALLNATQIGEMVSLSARKVNLLLIEKELQYKTDEKNIPYRPTEKGKEFSRMVPSVAKHKDQSVFQLRWRPEVAELLKANQ